jgi:hypothetical protein
MCLYFLIKRCFFIFNISKIIIEKNLININTIILVIILFILIKIKKKKFEKIDLHLVNNIYKFIYLYNV